MYYFKKKTNILSKGTFTFFLSFDKRAMSLFKAMSTLLFNDIQYVYILELFYNRTLLTISDYINRLLQIEVFFGQAYIIYEKFQIFDM